MAAFGIPQISTGDILRENIAKGTELGKLPRASMDQGQLVPDQIVNDMVQTVSPADDVHAGYILDGFPRTLAQATWLDAHLPDLPRDASRWLPSTSVLTRLNCFAASPAAASVPSASTSTTSTRNPPASPGICDVDGSPLQQRPDDTEAAFTERMKAYESQTAPVIEHYRASKPLPRGRRRGHRSSR